MVLGRAVSALSAYFGGDDTEALGILVPYWGGFRV